MGVRNTDYGAKAQREIGPVGTAVRVVLGLLFLGLGIQGDRVTVIHGRLKVGFDVLSVIFGALVFPAVVLGWQWLRNRRRSTRLNATGPSATTINMLVLFALFFTPYYAPSLYFLGGAAGVFYGSSMLLAALRGYRGCEVLAISNWLLGRDDEVGCLVFSPIDWLERPPKRTTL